MPACNDCQEICPVSNIRVYLHRPFAIRGPIVKLLRSYAQPFKAVGATTISRWVKATLELSVIDIHNFSAHSTRSGETSKAWMCGMSVKDIFNATGWTAAATFGRFYDRPVNDNGFISNVFLKDFLSQEGLLYYSQPSLKSHTDPVGLLDGNVESNYSTELALTVRRLVVIISMI